MNSAVLVPSRKPKLPEPTAHQKWELKRVISGHLGWVRALAVDCSNEWFASGSADRTIKIWELASGKLRLTLTGHISTVRAIDISHRHPYLFSAGEDKRVLCWDLEQNRIIRHYHGHLHGVYALAIHPRLDFVVTGSRDGTARLWDMRTRQTVVTLTGHRGAVSSVLCMDCDPQVATGSTDNTIRLWDLRKAGACRTELTHHKKSVRALAACPTEWTLISGAADDVKRFALPDGIFLNDYQIPFSADRNAPVISDSILNCLAINEDGVLVGGLDDGLVRFWDYSSGTCFQEELVQVQPGSLECEAGVLACTFDRSGMRLLTGEVDKTIKVWGEVIDEDGALE